MDEEETGWIIIDDYVGTCPPPPPSPPPSPPPQPQPQPSASAIVLDLEQKPTLVVQVLEKEELRPNMYMVSAYAATVLGLMYLKS